MRMISSGFKRKRFRSGSGAARLAAAGAACAAAVFLGTAGAASAHGAAAHAVVRMTPGGFEPKEITVVAGTEIRFENHDTQARWPASNIHPTHRAYPDTDIEQCGAAAEPRMFDACRGVAPGSAYIFVFAHPGAWRYHDHLVPRWGGMIRVTAVSDAGEPAGHSEGAAVEGEDGRSSRAAADPARGESRGYNVFARVGAWFRAFIAAARELFASGARDVEQKAVSTRGADAAAGGVPDEEGAAEANGAAAAADASGAAVAPDERAAPPRPPRASGRVFDQGIAADAERIFSDVDALYSYIKKFGPAQTLERLFALEPGRGNCHDPAHDVGRLAYELFDAAAFQKCTALCQSGCYHGAVEAYFRAHGTDDFGENLGRLCTADLTAFVSHQCVHGVGHGLLAWSGYDLPAALASCDEMPERRESCYSGVFMENIAQSMAAFLKLEGHTTEYIRDDDPHYPCSAVESRYRPSCYFLQTDQMARVFAGDFRRVSAACDEVSDIASRGMCYESLGRTVGGYHRHDPTGALAACGETTSAGARAGCLRGSIQDAYWDPTGAKDGVAYCRLLSDDAEKSLCYGVLFGRARELALSVADQAALCALVEPAFAERCRALAL